MTTGETARRFALCFFLQNSRSLRQVAGEEPRHQGFSSLLELLLAGVRRTESHARLRMGTVESGLLGFTGLWTSQLGCYRHYFFFFYYFFFFVYFLFNFKK